MIVCDAPPAHYELIADKWRPATTRRNDSLVVPVAPTVDLPDAPRDAPLSSGDIATSIQQARVAARLSQQELAVATNVPIAEIRAIERRTVRFPPRALLQKISGVLGVVFA